MDRRILSSALIALVAIAVALSAGVDVQAQVRGGRGGRSGGHTSPNFQRPSHPGMAVSRPTGAGGLVGNIGGGRPAGSRVPNVQKPGGLTGGSSPINNYHRPNLDSPKLPNAVGSGVGQQIKDAKPIRPGGDKPGTIGKPDLPHLNRPGSGPSSGQLNDFLGIDGRPNIDKGNLAKVGDRIGDANNIHVGNINVGNSIDFSKDRTAWVNNVHSAGDQIRIHAGDRFAGIYNNGRYRHGVVGGYPYYVGWTRFGPYYGWRPITYVALGTFIGATWANAQPVYYAYGTGGNVYYENNIVYVNDQPAGTPTEYAAQATAMVSAVPEKADDSEWMPLGVFALTQEGVDDSQIMLELAVNKQGIIAGTYTNEATQLSRSLKGMVDKQSQRIAIGFADGKNSAIVLETGVENITQDEAPGLLHYGADMSVPILLVRLHAPAEPGKN